MKKLFLIALICGISITSKATVIVVSIVGTVFSPSTFEAQMGDTIKWVASTGSHTTTSLVIPTAAATWNATLDATHPDFAYIAMVPGSYRYNCTPHGEAGSFTVASPAGVSDVKEQNVFSVSPNPASGKLHVELVAANAATVYLTDLTGRRLLTKNINTGNVADIDLKGITTGNYIVTVVQGGKSAAQQVNVVN